MSPVIGLWEQKCVKRKAHVRRRKRIRVKRSTRKRNLRKRSVVENKGEKPYFLF